MATDTVKINDIASQLTTASRLVVSTDFFWVYMASGSQVKIPAEFVRAYLTDGITPAINSSGNWEINGTDTGVKAEGTTPKLKSADDGIKVSYDGGTTWSTLVLYSDMDIGLDKLVAEYQKIVDSEQSRADAETARQTAETERASAETARAEAESTRVSEFKASKDACDAATTKANTAATTASESAAKADTATANLTEQQQKVETAISQSETATANAQQAAEDTLASKAAIESDEATRQANEKTRQANETTRQGNETTRQSQESARVTAEEARATAESSRATAETQREKDFSSSKSACDTATADCKTQTTECKTQTDLAEEQNQHPTYVGDDNYVYKWDTTTKAYVKTDLYLKGDNGSSPKIVNGTWWTYNDATGEYENTNISVSSDYELTKAKVEGVLTGNITSHTHSQYAVASDVTAELDKKADQTSLDSAVTRIASLESGSATTIETTGSGNAVTAISKSGTKITATKGTTFLTSHQDISGKADKATTLAGYGITDAKIESGKITLGSNSITPLTSHQSLADYLKTADADTKYLGKTDKAASASTADTATTAANATKVNNHTVESDVPSDAKFTDTEYIIPTLSAAPTETTLTFTDDDGETRSFRIGHMARVADSDSDHGYKFYQLYDITSGKAVWGEISGEGGDSSNETVSIALVSNQSNADASLNGATITIKSVSSDEEIASYTWAGNAIQVSLPAGLQVEVSASGVTDYRTPSSQTFVTKVGGSRSIALQYDTEVVTVTVSANDGTSMSGQTVTVNGTKHTYSGSFSVKVPFGTSYSVSASDKTCYATPATQTFTANQASRSVILTYNTETVTISLTSNQSTSDSSIKGATVTVKSGSTTLHTLTWQGSALTAKVAYGASYTVSVSSVTGYRTPSAQSFTANSKSRTVTMQYDTEIVTVTVSSDDSSSVAGQVITVNGTNYTYSAAFSVKIPYGTSYTVSASEKEAYTTPASQTYTAGQLTRSVSLQYVYCPIMYSYITLDMTITDPASMVSGDVGGEAIKAIRADSHRYLGKLTASGVLTVCQLMDSDSTKYSDGTAATLTGSEGDVFMIMPRFYTKAEKLSTDKWKIGFAYGGDPGDGWKAWGGDDAIGVYEAYVSSSKVYSYSGKTPSVSISQATFKTYARNRGTGFSIVKHKHQNIMAFLFYALYGNTNAQAVCGAGTSSYPKTAGQTNSLGMTDTTTSNGNSMSINFMGLENWWGDLFEFEDNVVVDNRAWKVTEDDGTVRSAGTAYSSSGYISKMMVGDYLDTIPTAASGSETSGLCDYYYPSSSSSRVVLRSCFGSDTSGGLVCTYAADGSSYTYSSSGSRLAFSGEIVKAASVSAYKALSAIG